MTALEGNGRPYGVTKGVHERWVFDAFALLDTRADINGPGARGLNAIDHVCRCEPTRQNEATLGV